MSICAPDPASPMAKNVTLRCIQVIGESRYIVGKVHRTKGDGQLSRELSGKRWQKKDTCWFYIHPDRPKSMFNCFPFSPLSVLALLSIGQVCITVCGCAYILPYQSDSCSCSACIVSARSLKREEARKKQLIDQIGVKCY